MVEWKTYKLSEIGEVVGGATPSTKNPDYYDGDIAWLTPKDLSTFSERYISKGERSITEVGYKSCSTKMLPANTVIFSSRAPIGYVAIAQNEMCTNQGFKSVVPGSKVNYLFLYYLLKYKKDAIEGMGSGTTFKEVSGNVMKGIEVTIPIDIAVQKRIAAVLDSIDSKIENNNHINRNLEEQIKILYQAFITSHSSKSWRYGRLQDLAEVCYGKDHKKLLNGLVPVYGSGGVMRHVDRSIYDKESVLIPRKGTLNNVKYVDEPFWSVDTMFYTKMKLLHAAKYLHQFLIGIDLASYNAGSAVPSMTTEILNSLKVKIPTNSELTQFETMVVPLYLSINNNNKSNDKLADLRDALLPQLMSGEIDVSDIGLSH